MKKIFAFILFALLLTALCLAQADTVVSSDSVMVSQALKPTISSVSVGYSSISKGGTQSFTVKTSTDATYLFLYAENGVLVNKWKNNYSSVSGSTRTWNVSQSIGSAGDRTLTFIAGLSTTPSSAPWSVSFIVSDASIYSAGTYGTINRGDTQTFTARTSTSANYLMLYAEDGMLVKTWPANGNSYISGSYRYWNVPLTINSPGSRRMTLRTGTTTKPASGSYTVSFTVNDVKINSASISNSELKKISISASTTANAHYLMLYAENGQLVKTWDSGSYSYTSGSTRYWNGIVLPVSVVGQRTFTLRAGTSGNPISDPKTISCTVMDTKIISASASGTINRGETERFSVTTDKTANNLFLYAEEGQLIKTWPASGNSYVSGSYRYWNVNLPINSAGNRRLTFAAGAGNAAASQKKTVSFTVTNVNITYATCSSSINQGDTQRFSVRTTTNANYLMMYAENGQLVNTWPAGGNNSYDSGSTRYWTVYQTIGTAGERTLTFRAGTTRNPVSDARTLSFTVKGATIYSAYVDSGTISKSETALFSVTTTSSAKYLMMYAEDGTTLIKTWAASGNSYVAGSYRYWNVNLPINSPGSRRLTFKAGVTSAPASNAYTVSFTVKDITITSATAGSSSMDRGTTQTFTVKTSTNASYLLLYAENGAKVKTWPAGSGYNSDSGSTRTWKVSMAIGSSGDRTLTFKAGVSENKPVTTGIPVKFFVYDTTMYSATAQEPVIYKGGTETFTVVTTPSSQYLMLYAEDGTTLVNRWSAGASSTVTGGRRIWIVQQTISAPGERTLYFRSGATTTPASRLDSANCNRVSFTVNTVKGGTTYRALLIGETNYLDAAANDLTLMQRLLNSVKGPNGTSYQVTVRRNLTPTGIKNAIASTFAEADADDVSLFYIASHGNSSSSGRYAGALGTGSNRDTYYTSTTNSYSSVYVEELRDWLKAIPGKVIVFIESCGAGAGIYDPDIAENKSADGQDDVLFLEDDADAFNNAVINAFASGNEMIEFPSADGVTPKTGELRESKFYVLAACRYRTNSYFWSSSKVSLFTECLAAGIGTSGAMPADKEGVSNGRTTLHELFAYINRHCDGDQKVQVYPKNCNMELFCR